MIPLKPRPGLIGPTWQTEFDALPAEMPYLVKHLIYTSTTTMIHAVPGGGKSMIATQIAVSLTTGTPVFAHFQVDGPKRVYYAALETNRHKDARRILAMTKGGLPFNPDNLCWDNDCCGIDLLNARDVAWLVDRIHSVFEPHFIVLDPAYRATPADLSKSENVSALMTNISYIRNQFEEASMLVLHHSRKPQLNAPSAYYGPVWFGANVDTLFALTEHEDGTSYENEKDRDSEVIDSFRLYYDKGTKLSTFAQSSLLPREQQVVAAYLESRRNGASVMLTIDGIKEATEASESTVMRALKSEIVTKMTRLHKTLGKATQIELLPLSGIPSTLGTPGSPIGEPTV